MSKARLHIKIFGQVQGVFFRHHIQKLAGRFALTGWVRNNTDGIVECIAEGERGNLEKLYKWCQKGPRWARVEHIEEEWSDPKGEFNKFDIEF